MEKARLRRNASEQHTSDTTSVGWCRARSAQKGALLHAVPRRNRRLFEDATSGQSAHDPRSRRRCRHRDRSASLVPLSWCGVQQRLCAAPLFESLSTHISQSRSLWVGCNISGRIQDVARQQADFEAIFVRQRVIKNKIKKHQQAKKKSRKKWKKKTTKRKNQ